MHFRQSWRWGVQSQHTMRFTPPHSWAEKVMQRKIWIEDQLQRAIYNLMGSSSLWTPTLKLPITSTASQKASPPSLSSQSTPLLPPDCFDMNSEAEQSTDRGQTPAFFLFGRLVSTSITSLSWITMQMFAEAAGEGWQRARSELPGFEKGRTTSSKGSINACQHEVDLRHHCLSDRKEISINRAIWLTPMEMLSAPKFHNSNQGRDETHGHKTQPGKCKT